MARYAVNAAFEMPMRNQIVKERLMDDDTDTTGAWREMSAG